MITRDKTSSIISISFLAIIIGMIINMYNKFNFLDLFYMLFIIGCFIRYMLIKK